MKVTTVSASARFSKALGDGTHTTIELSAEAAVGEQENWREAQAGLYQELGQQQRALWPTRANGQPTNGNASNGNGRTDAMSEHYCQEHGVPFLAVRAVLDPVGRRLPPFVADIIADQGRNEWRLALRALAKRPYLAPQLITLALDSRRAKKTLLQTLLDIRPGLAAHLEEQEG